MDGLVARRPDASGEEAVAWIGRVADRLRAAGRWRIDRYRRVRCSVRHNPEKQLGAVLACPITAIHEPPVPAFEAAGCVRKMPGVSVVVGRRIMWAADGEPGEIRRALLAAVGLEETPDDAGRPAH